MAYLAGGLSLISSVHGYGLYRYDSLDANIIVDGAGYFNNSDDTLNLAVGDMIWVIDWATTVRTGTISDVSLHIVTIVNPSGAVDLSDDILVAGLVSSTD